MPAPARRIDVSVSTIVAVAVDPALRGAASTIAYSPDTW